MIQLIWMACRMQLAESRRQPAHLLILVTSPLFAVMFLSIAGNTRDPDAVTNAIFAPALFSLWFLSLDLGGTMINRERGQQTLNQLIGTPANLSAIVFGRILAVVGLAGLTFIEAYLMARLVFGVAVVVPHPALLTATVIVTLFAMAGTATALAALFVLSRQVMLFQNAMTYPFYILGAVFVPVGLLPSWLQPVTRIFFLSWSSELVRSCLLAVPVPSWAARLGVIAGLGALALSGGVWMTRRVVDRVRVTGEAVYA
ncbi:MAG TPA: ABC transporter permease [Micromonosporaceae bacterium]